MFREEILGGVNGRSSPRIDRSSSTTGASGAVVFWFAVAIDKFNSLV